MFALLVTLWLDQYQPIRHERLQGLLQPLKTLALQLNGGRHEHGRLAWFAAVIPAVVATWFAYLMLQRLGSLPAWLWQVSILYLSLRFKRHTQAARQIQLALSQQHIDLAEHAWAEWQATPPPNDLPRFTIMALLTGCLRETFGVIFWGILLAPFGPIGALAYRLTHAIAEHWLPDTHGEFARFSQAAVYWADWLPTRALALGFAVAGDFEDAIYGWRSHPVYSDNNLGILLATASGALDLPLLPESLPEETPVEAISAQDIASAISLLWRTLAIWLLLIALVSLGKH